MNPRISVLMSVYNGDRFLQEAIDSILKQDFEDFEFIIIDDGSTDMSKQLIEAAAQRDLRIRPVFQPNRGLIESLNRGLALAQAPLIARMDADDIALPWRLSRQLAEMTRRPNLLVLGGHNEHIDSTGSLIRLWRYPVGPTEIAKCFGTNRAPISHPSAIFRRDTIIEIGGYRHAFPYAEDADLWYRAYEHGEIDNLDAVVLRYRVHDSSVSARKLLQQIVSHQLAKTLHHVRKRGDTDPACGLNQAPNSENIELLLSNEADLRNFRREVATLVVNNLNHIGEEGLPIARKFVEDVILRPTDNDRSTAARISGSLFRNRLKRGALADALAHASSGIRTSPSVWLSQILRPSSLQSENCNR